MLTSPHDLDELRRTQMVRLGGFLRASEAGLRGDCKATYKELCKEN